MTASQQLIDGADGEVNEAGEGQLSQPELPRHERLASSLDWWTNLGVNISVFAFVGLQVPQIIKDFATPSSMADLQWPGYISGSMGNLLLATYFASVPDWAAVRVQAIGAITNFFVATQIYIAGYFPTTQFWTLAAIILIGLIIPSMYAIGCMPSRLFASWQEATTPIGFSALLFSVTATATKDAVTLLIVALVGLTVGTFLLALKGKVPILATLAKSLGGWLATFLFMFMPLPQLIDIITKGAKAAEAFQIGFTLLAIIGNGLGATRAFVIKERIWFVGSFWGLMIGGWLTAAAVWRANPNQCPIWALIPCTVFLLIYFVLIVVLNGIAKQQSPCRQFKFIFCDEREKRVVTDSPATSTNELPAP